MFEQWRKNREDRKRARQAEKCKVGKHRWILFSEATMVPEHDPATSNPLPHTRRVYKCSYCGKEHTEIYRAGQPPREPMTSAKHNSL